MAYDAKQLLAMSQTQLDDLFRASPAGPIPNGSGEGTAIIAPGTTYSMAIASVINHFGWQGKVFDAEKGVLKNRILSLGFEAIIAKVYKTPSSVLQDQLKVWDQTIAKKAGENAFFKKVLDSQKAFAERAGAWQYDQAVDTKIAWNHYFRGKGKKA
jgi:hypothetical protein